MKAEPCFYMDSVMKAEPCFYMDSVMKAEPCFQNGQIKSTLVANRSFYWTPSHVLICIRPKDTPIKQCVDNLYYIIWV